MDRKMPNEANTPMAETGDYLDQELEVDGGWETNSALGGMSYASSTTSVTPSVYEMVEENGRTYHAYRAGQYVMPNDEQEQGRLDYQHRVFRLSMGGKLHLAPIVDDPKHVLDVATGTGVWAIDFAQENPGCSVIGTDLSPIQPEYAPPNVSFEMVDAEDEWIFPMKFDLIHIRAIVSCFKDTKAVFKSALESLVPGTGYIFILDPLMPWKFLDPPPEDCALAEWGRLLVEAGNRIGMPWTRGQNYATWLRELGYVDVVEKVDRCPLSPWAKTRKRVSLLLQENVCNGVEGMSVALFTRVLGWSKEKFDDFIERVKRDIRDTNIHAYSEGVFIWARRPYPDEVPSSSEA